METDKPNIQPVENVQPQSNVSTDSLNLGQLSVPEVNPTTQYSSLPMPPLYTPSFNDVNEVLSSPVSNKDIIGTAQENMSKLQINNIANKMKMTAVPESRSSLDLDKEQMIRAGSDLVKNTSARRFDVKFGEYYNERLNDGTYLPNVKGGTIPGVDTEHINAKNQGTGQKWFNGVVKMIGKTGLYLGGNLLNPIYGVTEWMKTGNFDAVYSNDLVDWMNDQDKRLNHNLPNYMSKEERDMNILQKATTANFWANEVLGATSYTLAAIGSEAVWAYLTGGASIVAASGRLAFRSASKAAVKRAFSKGIAPGTRAYLSANKSAFNAYLRTMKPATAVSGALHNARFIWTSAGWEAAVESDGFRKEATKNYFDSFKAANGRLPNDKEFADFNNEVINAANTVYAANVGIVGLSNIILFGKYFGVGSGFSKGVSNRVNKVFGLNMVRGANESGRLVYQTAKPSTLQKIAGKTYYGLRKPLSEGLWEEGMQGVAQNTANDYIKSRFDPNSVEKNIGFLQALKQGFAEQFTSKEGWNEIGIGLIIGGFFGNVGFNRGRFEVGSEFREYGRSRANLQNQADYLNSNSNEIEDLARNRIIDENLMRNISALQATEDQNIQRLGNTSNGTLVDFGNLNAQDANSDVSEKDAQNGDFSSGIRNWNVSLFARMQMEEQRGSLEKSIANFNYVIDNIDEAELRDKFGVSPDVISDMKADFKADYQQKIENFERATSFADMLIGEEYGDLAKQALALNVFLAQENYSNIDGLLESLEKTLNQTGLRNYGLLMLGLGNNNRADINELNKLDADILDLSSRIGVLERTPGQQSDNEGVRSQVDQLSQQLIEMQTKRDNLYNQISSINLYGNFSLDPITQLTSGISYTADELIAATRELEKMDNIIETIKESNPQQYRVLNTLLTNLHEQIVEMHSYGETIKKMSDSRFMRNKQRRLLSLINGENTKYEPYSREIDEKIGSTMSNTEDQLALAQLKRNDADIDEAFNKGQISESEKFTFKAFNRMLDIYQYRGTLAENGTSPVVETLETETLNDFNNGIITIDDLANNIYEMARKSINNTQFTENEQSLYDSNEDVRNRVDDEANNLRLTRGDSALDQLDKLRQRANRLSAPENIHDYVKSVIDNFLNEEGNPINQGDVDRFRELLNKDTLSQSQEEEFFDLLDRINEASEQYGYDNIPDYIDLLNEIENSSQTSIANIKSVENVGDIVYDPEFNDVERNTRDHFNNMQNVEAVQARKSGGNWTISNISLNNFLDKIGIDSYSGPTSNGDISIQLPNGDIIKMKREATNGHITISETDADKLSEQTNLVIKKMDNIATDWIDLYTKDADGNLSIIYTESGYGATETDYVDTEALANLRGGSNPSMVRLQVDMNDRYNKKLISDYQKALESGNQEQILKATKNLIDNVVMKGIDENGSFISVSKSTEGKFTTKNSSFQALSNVRIRAFEMIKANPNRSTFFLTNASGESLSLPVDTVLPGRPNYNARIDENGNVVVESIGFNGQEPITNIGYINENGDLVLRTPNERISKAFVANIVKKDRAILKGNKIPIVVFKHPNGLEYAYPINLLGATNTNVQSTVDFLTEIIESGRALTQEDKKDISIAAIHYGLNPTEYTISFNVDNEDAIQQTIAIRDRLAELSTTPDINEWVNGSRDIMEILQSEATININLNGRAFHSMKVKLDMSSVVNSITQDVNLEKSIFGASRTGSIDYTDNVQSTSPVREEAYEEDLFDSRDSFLQDIADNSTDVLQIADAYDQAMDMAETENLQDWEKEAITETFNKASFERFGDRNYLDTVIRRNWIRTKAQESNSGTIDTFAERHGITTDAVIDFILDHPNKQVGKGNELTRALNKRFREIASRDSKTKIGGINSASGRNFLAGRRTAPASQNVSIEDVNPINSIIVLNEYVNPATQERTFDLSTMNSYEDFYEALNRNEELFRGFPFDLNARNDIYFYTIAQERNGVSFGNFKSQISSPVQENIQVESEVSEEDRAEIDRINQIDDVTERMAAEIDFIMSRLASGIGEASANKVREYADRILSGNETRESIIEGLSPSFIEGIDDLLRANNYEFNDDSSDVNDQLPFQYSRETFTPLPRKQFNQLVERLRQSGLALDVVVDQASFDKAIQTSGSGAGIMYNKQGLVYGVIDKNGTVYIRPDRLNANTPLHEFGHLWNNFVRNYNPALYEQGRKLIKNTVYWTRVNNEEIYKGLREEDRIDEALAMAIGDRGDAVVNQKGIGKRLLNWISKVWSWLNSQLAGLNLTQDMISGLTLEQFTDIAVSDLLSGRNFYEVLENNKLIAMHNIEENELTSALNIDGMAQPSVAITNRPYSRFGDVTLIGNKELIDPRDSKNKVYDRDIYSPSYPNVYDEIDRKEWTKFYNKWAKISSNLQLGLNGYLYKMSSEVSGGYATVGEFIRQMHTAEVTDAFLKENGIVVDRPYKYRIDNFLTESVDIDTAIEIAKKWNSSNLSEKQKEEGFFNDIFDQYKKERYNTIYAIEKNKKRTQELVDELSNTMYDKYKDDSYISDINVLSRNIRSLDNYAFDNKLRNAVIENGLSDQLDNWIKDQVSPIFTGQQFFYNQKDKKVSHNVENVVKFMGTGDPIAREVLPFNSVGQSISRSARRLKSINDIRKASGRIVSEEQFNIYRDEMKDLFDQVGGFVNSKSENIFDKLDNTAQSLGDLAALKTISDSDIASVFERNNLTIDELAYPLVKDYVQKTQMPLTTYFEAKMQRGVKVDEFSAAVIPSDASDELELRLRNRGLKVVRYNDQEHRMKLVTHMSNHYNLMFQAEQTEMNRIKSDTIFDGTFMLAPNGQPTNLTERQWLQVRTTNFKNWFGDWQNTPYSASRVVDENGEPKVVYHGSPYSGITEFDHTKKGKVSSGLKEFGSFFTSRENVAEFYRDRGVLSPELSDRIDKEIAIIENKLMEVRNNRDYEYFSAELDRLKSERSGRVYETFLNIRKPKRFNGRGEDFTGWQYLRQDVGYDIKRGTEAIEAVVGLNTASTVDIDYDGIIGTNIAEISAYGQDVTDFLGDVYLVWNSTQVKSAIDNNGEFDSSNPDMRFQVAAAETISDVENITSQDLLDESFIFELRKNQEDNSNCR